MAEMTISQCLRRVAKLKGQLAETLQRAQSAVTHEENKKPAFNFKTSLEKADGLREDLIKAETALRVANAKNTVKYDGRNITLLEATCRLQEYKSRIAWLQKLQVRAQAETSEESREFDTETSKYVKVSTKFLCALPEAERVAEVDRTQEKFDTLNDAVETVNQSSLLAL